jgi:hypothetical protein
MQNIIVFFTHIHTRTHAHTRTHTHTHTHIKKKTVSHLFKICLSIFRICDDDDLEVSENRLLTLMNQKADDGLSI